MTERTTYVIIIYNKVEALMYVEYNKYNGVRAMILHVEKYTRKYCVNRTEESDAQFIVLSLF